MKRILTLLFLVLIQSANAAITDDLQLHASFDGNADDMSGNGNHGIVYGAALTEDRNGNPNSAYYFNGALKHGKRVTYEAEYAMNEMIYSGAMI